MVAQKGAMLNHWEVIHQLRGGVSCGALYLPGESTVNKKESFAYTEVIQKKTVTILSF